jgi:hypothetical protein
MQGVLCNTGDGERPPEAPRAGPRLLRDPRLPPAWSDALDALGGEQLRAAATTPAALLAEALARDAVLLAADPACELARCELRAPLPSLIVLPPAGPEGLRSWLDRYAAAWSSGLILKLRTATSCSTSTLSMLGHEGTFRVADHELAWRAELRPAREEGWMDISSVQLVLRAAPWTGSALVLPTTRDARPTPAELSLAARVGLAYGWAPGADLPDLHLDFYDWVGADHLQLCPCCDYRTLRSRGDYHVCPICDWEDDGTHPAHLDDYAACNGRHLRRARSTFRRFGSYTRRGRRRSPDALRSCYTHEPLGDLRRPRLMLTEELPPEVSKALARVGVLVPAPVAGPSLTRHARREGAVVVTSDPAHVARRCRGGRHPSLVLMDPARAGETAARIRAHARELRRGALLLGDRLVDLQGVGEWGGVHVCGQECDWRGQLHFHDGEPHVVLRVQASVRVLASGCGTSSLIAPAAGLFTTGRNGRPRLDSAALLRIIEAGLEAGWRCDAEGPDVEIAAPP